MTHFDKNKTKCDKIIMTMLQSPAGFFNNVSPLCIWIGKTNHFFSCLKSLENMSTCTRKWRCMKT